MEIMLVIPYGLIQVSNIPNLPFFLITETPALHSTYKSLLGL